MKLKCIKSMTAHWGSILTEGNEYEVIEFIEKEIEIITNYKEYWKHTYMGASSITWIRKGYTQETLHEVIPGYLKMEEYHALYTKRIKLPFVVFKCDDNSKQSFCLTTHDELINVYGGAEDEKRKGKVSHCYTIYFIDDNFDYVQTRRDKKLNELGI